MNEILIDKFGVLTDKIFKLLWDSNLDTVEMIGILETIKFEILQNGSKLARERKKNK